MDIQHFVEQACRVFAVLMVACLAVMVALVFGNVVLRYGFNSGITLSEELSRWLFVWMTFLGALVALRRRAHLGTDSVVARLPVLGRKLCLGASQLLMLFACWLMLRGAWDQMRINWDTTSAVMQVSMAWLYLSGVVFAALAIVILLLDAWRLLTGQVEPHELVAVTDSEHGAPAATGTCPEIPPHSAAAPARR